MKRIFVLPIFYLMLHFSIAQNQTIRGVVVDRNTRNTLVGANVMLINSNPIVGSTTDIDGRFRIEKVKVGRIGIRVSFLGYTDVSLNNIELTSGKEMVLNIEMEEKVMTSKEVVITANGDKIATQNKMTTVSSRGFTVEETQRYAGSRNDVGRMAANYAGVRGVSDSRNDIIIRGNSPSGLLWRLEGVDIPSPNHYSNFGTTGGPVSLLNSNLMSNSDFMTGAFPAEYGNAVAGVFDLKMRCGNNEKHEFLAQVGLNGFEGGLEGPISKKTGASYLINYRYSTMEVLKKLGYDFGVGTGVPQYQDVSFKINLPKTKMGSFSLFGVGGISYIKMLVSNLDTTKPNNKLDFTVNDNMDVVNSSNMGVLALTHILPIGKTAYLKTILSMTYHSFKTNVDTLNNANWTTHPYYRVNYSESKPFISIIFNKRITSHHSVKAGMMASQLKYSLLDSIFNSYYNHFRKITNYNGYDFLWQPYLQWQFKLTDDVVFNAGWHFIFYSLNNTWSLEPRAGIKWQFLPTHSLSFGYGRHSQLNPIQAYFKQKVLYDSVTYVNYNKNLDLLHSQHFVLSYDWIITETMRLKTELYYQIVSNVPVDAEKSNSFSTLNLGSDYVMTVPYHMNNSGSGSNYGVELTLEKFLSKGWYFLITGSLYESKYKGSDGVERNTAFSGTYTGNVLVGKEFILGRKNNEQKLRKSISFDLKTNRSGGQRYTPINEEASKYYQLPVYKDSEAYSKQFSDYSKTDLKISFKINGKRITQEFAVDCTNLFNEKNVLSQRMNKKSGTLENSYQLGMLIVPQWRMTF